MATTTMRATQAQARTVSIASGASGPKIDDGTLEALKWLGAALMTLDHVNKYLLGDRLGWAFDAGRLVMPIFGFVLAYNLARPGGLDSGRYVRIMKRLALCGLLATPAFLGLGGLLYGWWPLNILFMLLTATAVLWLREKGGVACLLGAIGVFLIGGSSVEFWWPAVAFVLFARWYFKTGSIVAPVLGFLMLASVYIINGNSWALAALPIMLLAPAVKISVPRIRYFFYAYYPVHLSVIYLIRLAIHHG